MHRVRIVRERRRPRSRGVRHHRRRARASAGTWPTRRRDPAHDQRGLPRHAGRGRRPTNAGPRDRDRSDLGSDRDRRPGARHRPGCSLPRILGWRAHRPRPVLARLGPRRADRACRRFAAGADAERAPPQLRLRRRPRSLRLAVRAGCAAARFPVGGRSRPPVRADRQAVRRRRRPQPGADRPSRRPLHALHAHDDLRWSVGAREVRRRPAPLRCGRARAHSVPLPRPR